MYSRGASRVSTALPLSLVVCDSCIVLTETGIEIWLVTSACQVLSVVSPLPAGSRTVLVWFTWASDLYCVVSSTCRYHCRPPRTTTRARAIAYRPYSRLRDRGIIGSPPRAAAAACCACARDAGRGAATLPTVRRRTSCP